MTITRRNMTAIVIGESREVPDFGKQEEGEVSIAP
jgi:hypothetical protein